MSQETQNKQTSLWVILQTLGQYKGVLFGVPSIMAVLVYAYCRVTPPIYSATTKVLPPQYNQYNAQSLSRQLGGDSTLANAALSLKNPSDLYVGILQSGTILDAMAKRFDLINYYEVKVLDDVRTKLTGATKVSVGRDGILSIEVEDESPYKAAEMANAYVEELYTYSRNLAQREQSRRGMFYGGVLSDAKTKLDEADIELLEVENKTGFTRLGGQDEAIVSAASQLQSTIVQKNVQLRAMENYATDNHPDVKILKSEIAALENQLTKLRSNGAKTTNAKSENAAFVGVGRAPQAMLEHAQKVRNVEYWKGMVDMLGRYDELGKIDETRDLSLIQLLDKAVPPHYKSKPRTALNVILAFVAGFILSMMSIFAWEWLYASQRRNAAMANEISELKRSWSWRRRKPRAESR